MVGEPVKSGDAREQIIDRLQRFHDRLEAIHNG